MSLFFLAIKSYSKAFNLLFSKDFWWFMLFPLLFTILIFWSGNKIALYFAEPITDAINSLLLDVSWLQWMVDPSNFFIKMLLGIINFLFFAYFGAYIILIIMSPIYSWLSERVEAHLIGKEYTFSLKQLFKDMVRGTYIAIRNSILQFIIGLAIFIFSFVPLLGLLAPILIFVTSAYFYGFAFVDYAVERKGLAIKESIKYINQRFYLVLGIGSIFSIALMIPLLNIIVCSFISLLSVIASVIALEKISNKIK